MIILAAGAATIATALAQSEGRADLSTLAAVGAPPVFRYRFAAARGLVTAGVGAAAGLILATAPAIVLAHTVTLYPSGSEEPAIPPVIAVPWPTLAVAALAIPAAAAASAMLVAARAPDLRRRTT